MQYSNNWMASTSEHRDKKNENDLDPEDGNESSCPVCELPIFSTPYETDEDGHRLHKCCAEMPKELIGHPLHQKPLYLHHKLRDSSLHINCKRCQSRCYSFFYQCADENCAFACHVSCAMRIRIKILHRSHRHELIPFPNIQRCPVTCAACGSKDGRDSYWCYFCSFYIHRDCATFPFTILHKKHNLEGQQHVLALTYFLSEVFVQAHYKACSFCHEELSREAGGYYCTRCDIVTHIKCAISDTDSFEPVSSRNMAAGLIHFPMENETTSFLKYLRENSSSSNIATEEEKETIMRQVHHHSLTFYGEGFSLSSSYLCDACIQPISPPFYSCPHSPHFYLHHYCANLPLKYQHPSHAIYSYARQKDCKDLPLGLSRFTSASFRSISSCVCCRLHHNGLAYSCEECGSTLDVGCTFLPKSITHKLHSKFHILSLLLITWAPFADLFCYICGDFISSRMIYYYQCRSCFNFSVHIKCAVLPLNIKSQSDRHPLKLTSPESLTIKDGDNFCEVCERVMSPYSWCYQCEECMTSFHINCIPCVGRYSKVKFGGTIRVRRHECPLTPIRLLTSYDYSCAACNKTIEGSRDADVYGPGREDGVAFECTKCRFWLHYHCAEKEFISA